VIVRILGEGQFRVNDDVAAKLTYILPFSDATVAEVRKLLADGVIPGDSIGLP